VTVTLSVAWQALSAVAPADGADDGPESVKVIAVPGLKPVAIKVPV